jgi:16S rRNA processing protein RimM
VGEARIHGSTVVGRLAGIETREQALALKGQAVAVRREALPEPEEGRYYLADLVGLEVVNEQGAALGVVTRTYSNGAHDVIEVAGDRTRLIPWVSAVVKEVDLLKKRVQVEWGADW